MGLFDVFRSKKELQLRAEIQELKRKSEYNSMVRQFIFDNPDVVTEDAENMPYARVFEHDGKFEYEIFVNGNITIRQDFDPNSEGFIPMTEEYATSVSSEIVKRLREQYGDNK